MNVMYLCNDAYAYIAGISMLSLIENNRDVDYIHFFLVGDSISDENKNKLFQTVNGINRELTILQKPDIKALIGCNVETHWWIENVFSRVFLGEVFKDYPNIKRLIYIDCDTLVVGGIKDLWEIDLGDRLGAGVLEAMGNLHKKSIGLKPENAYFNAGMFLINIEKWVTEKYDQRAREFINYVNGKLEYADESVLNGIAAADMLIVSPKYNMTSLSVYFDTSEVKKYRKPAFHYTESERQTALKDVRIIHFTSTFMDVRPWEEGSKHPYAKKWLEYKEKSCWKDTALSKDNRDLKKKIARLIAIRLPKEIRLRSTGFIHSYLKPLKYIRISG